ncbi:MAG: class I SAM-dependent methyltransferase [Lentisphaerae bacterium]|nr:class I SAM-dependent methyltransferase [Lentisphaerota bacterium]
MHPALKRIAETILRATYAYGLPVLAKREELPYILNARALIGAGAEIGVREGEFSKYLLEHWKGKLLYSVDPWKEYPREEYPDISNVDQKRHDQCYQTAIKRLGGFGERSRVMRMTSEEAASNMEDDSLDFVYIDAMHHYAAVKQDLNLWYPKVRAKGVLCGDDFLDGTIRGTVFEVKRAVLEFADSLGCKVWVGAREPIFKTWLMFKGKET